jgi:hypothetical protein
MRSDIRHDTADGARRRRCIASGEVRPREQLIRFVRDPEGGLVADVAARLPGRGVWVGADPALIERAASKGLFARGLGRDARPDPDLSHRVAELLARHWLGLLGIARRAGELAVGFEQVRELAAEGRVGLLVVAADAAPASRARLRALAPAADAIALFSRDELARALGRENVVQLAVRRGRLARRLADEARRLEGFRPTEQNHGQPG